MTPEDEGRERLIQVVGRPLLVVFWALVFWGTLYAAAFLHAAFEDGPRAALERVLSGPDVGVGFVNLALAALAVLVWGLVVVAVWPSRASPVRKHRVGRHDS